MEKQFKYFNLITCQSIDEFQIQCVLNSYSSMTVKQNISFINEAVKFSTYLTTSTVNYVDNENFSNYYLTPINDTSIKIYIPIGLMTICDVILNSTLLDSLAKNSKFHKHLMLKSYSTFATEFSFEADFFKLILMHVLRKFPDLHKKQINFFKHNTINLRFTPIDVKHYFSKILKYNKQS